MSGIIWMVGASQQAAAAAGGFLLDTVPMDYGFSFRQLATGITDVINARRDGDDAEQAFASNELGNMPSFADGGNDSLYMKNWYNQGTDTSVVSVTQGGTSAQPRLVNSLTPDTVNGFYSAYFSTNKFLNTTISGVDPHSSGFDAFIVFKNNSDGTILNMSDSTNAAKYIAIADSFSTTSTRSFYRWTSTVIAQDTIADNSIFSLVHVYFDGTTMYHSFNGRTYVTATPTITASNPNRLEIGRYRSNNPGLYANANVCEVLLKIGNLTSGQRTTVIDNLNTYYSIY